MSAKNNGTITLEQAMNEYTARINARSAKRASSDNPDGSSHPTASAPDNTQPAKEGERSAENEADVKANIPATINSAPEASPREDGSDNVDYHGAPALENEQGVPPVGTTQDDPGTESRLDVSTEKMAAEQKRIAEMVKRDGRAKAAAELSSQAMADLDAALAGKTDSQQNKRAAAEAGAAAASADLRLDPQIAERVKRAAAEAEEMGRVIGAEYAQFFHQAKKAAARDAVRAELMRKVAAGEINQEEAEAALQEDGEGEDEGEGAGDGEGEGGGEMPPEAGGGEVLPPEDLGALMELAQGGGVGGGMPSGPEEGAVPEEGAMALSDALDGLGLTPEQLLELEAAIQEEQGAAPEAAAVELGKVARALQAVGQIRDMERVGRLNKRASASRTALTAQVQQDIMKKAAFMRGRYMAKLQAARPAAKPAVGRR